jgi:hypothetical protein
MADFNRNPTGKNQWNLRELWPMLIPCVLVIVNLAQIDDERLRDALFEYHRKRLTNNKEIAALLEREHGIVMRYVST